MPRRDVLSRRVLLAGLGIGLLGFFRPTGGAAAQQTNPLQQLNPFKPSTPPTPTVQLNAAQRDTLKQVNSYFNGIRTLAGNFTQFGPDGTRSDGKFALHRPGRIRFAYTKPSTLDVISDGVDVIVRDRKLATQDLYPLSQTPLKFLLSDKIDLTSEANVSQVSIEPDLVTVVVTQETVFGDGKLTLLFDRVTTELKQWVVTDAQGLETTVVVFETVANQPVDAKQFVIDRQRILQ